MGKKVFVMLLVSVGTMPPYYLVTEEYLKALLWSVATVVLFWLYIKLERL